MVQNVIFIFAINDRNISWLHHLYYMHIQSMRPRIFLHRASISGINSDSESSPRFSHNHVDLYHYGLLSTPVIGRYVAPLNVYRLTSKCTVFYMVWFFITKSFRTFLHSSSSSGLRNLRKRATSGWAICNASIHLAIPMLHTRITTHGFSSNFADSKVFWLATYTTACVYMTYVYQVGTMKFANLFGQSGPQSNTISKNLKIQPQQINSKFFQRVYDCLCL